MLIAVKIKDGLILVYNWEPGGCATLNSHEWLGWSTEYESSHPAQSKDEFIHKCITEPGDYFIQANENGILIKKGVETLVERTIDEL